MSNSMCSSHNTDYRNRRRCGGACGFFLALSGGIDSCATATIVFSMCRLVHNAMIVEKNEQVLKDARRLCAKESSWLPESPQEICNHLLHT